MKCAHCGKEIDETSMIKSNVDFSDAVLDPVFCSKSCYKNYMLDFIKDELQPSKYNYSELENGDISNLEWLLNNSYGIRYIIGDSRPSVERAFDQIYSLDIVGTSVNLHVIPLNKVFIIECESIEDCETCITDFKYMLTLDGLCEKPGLDELQEKIYSIFSDLPNNTHIKYHAFFTCECPPSYCDEQIDADFSSFMKTVESWKKNFSKQLFFTEVIGDLIAEEAWSLPEFFGELTNMATYEPGVRELRISIWGIC